MGSLTRILSAGQLNMNKATISVWFRIPTEAALAVQARDTSTDSDVQVMDHVVPILMWGSQRESTIYEGAASTVFCEYPPGFTIAGGTAPFNSLFYLSGSSRNTPAQPSCIGVKCLPGQDPKLFVHIQPNAAPSFSNMAWNSGPGYTCPVTVGEPIPDFSDGTVPGTLADGAVGNSGASNVSGPYGGSPVVSLDVWHHLLISWWLRPEAAVGGNTDDVGTQDPAVNISAYSSMYCALDDVNKDGNNLPATWVGQVSDFSDRNAVVCGGIMGVAGFLYNPNPRAGHGPDPDPYQPPSNTAASGSMDYGTIPSSPLWIPGTPSIVTQSRGTIVANQQIDKYGLQIFDNLALDASIEANRRLFIGADLKPVATSVAETALGQPKIRFKSSKDWKNGKNSGSLGGTFSKTGTINNFSPGPGD